MKQRLGALLTSEYFDNHGRPQIEFICGESWRVDFIARFETLTNDWETIRAVLGVDGVLPRLNAGDHRPYWEYFDDEMVDMVADRYAEDTEAFSYEFPERLSSGQMSGVSGRTGQGAKACVSFSAGDDVNAARDGDPR